LAKLAEGSFLNLWSYPNPYRDQKLSGSGDGKELCDLLVVCGKHIIIFSEKNIKWTDAEPSVAWSRWFKRAVVNAAQQISGAERWISEFPDRIYLDKACKTPFPIEFPEQGNRIFHKIVVARGAGEACKKYFEGGSGSFLVDASVSGKRHYSGDQQEIRPFTIGDIDPDGDYIHVLDDASLDVVLSELDTITDLAEYLTKKAAFVRSGHLTIAHGEEDLLAYYMVRTNDEGVHDFTPPDGGKWGDGQVIALDGTHYRSLLSNPQYAAKKKADQVSYIWDLLITNFTEHMLGGTSIVADGFDYDLKKSELAVRYMALEPRFHRRAHGEAVQGAMQLGWQNEIFFRAMISGESASNNETGFFFLSMKYLDWMEQRGGYPHYRWMRQEYLLAYAKGMLVRYPYLKRVVGIAAEPPARGRGSSEDIGYVEQAEWSEDDIRTINAHCRVLGILRDGYEERKYEGQEFPETTLKRGKTPPKPKRRYTRKQRKRMRANQAKTAARSKDA